MLRFDNHILECNSIIELCFLPKLSIKTMLENINTDLQWRFFDCSGRLSALHKYYRNHGKKGSFNTKSFQKITGTNTNQDKEENILGFKQKSNDTNRFEEHFLNDQNTGNSNKCTNSVPEIEILRQNTENRNRCEGSVDISDMQNLDRSNRHITEYIDNDYTISNKNINISYEKSKTQYRENGDILDTGSSEEKNDSNIEDYKKTHSNNFSHYLSEDNFLFRIYELKDFIKCFAELKNKRKILLYIDSLPCLIDSLINKQNIFLIYNTLWEFIYFNDFTIIVSNHYRIMNRFYTPRLGLLWINNISYRIIIKSIDDKMVYEIVQTPTERLIS